MAKPEKNRTGKPRPPGEDVAAKQVAADEADFLSDLDRATEPLAGAASRPDRGSPKKSADDRPED